VLEREFAKKETVTPEAEANCEISEQFFTFSSTKFRIDVYRSRAWTVILCKHTIQKYENSMGGVAPPSRPLGTPVASSTLIRRHVDRMPCIV